MNGGTNFTTSMPEARKPARSILPPSQAPMPSIIRRTRTPCSALARKATPIRSPRRSWPRMKVQTSSVVMALSITSSTARRESAPSAWTCRPS